VRNPNAGGVFGGQGERANVVGKKMGKECKRKKQIQNPWQNSVRGWTGDKEWDGEDGSERFRPW